MLSLFSLLLSKAQVCCSHPFSSQASLLCLPACSDLCKVVVPDSFLVSLSFFHLRA